MAANATPGQAQQLVEQAVQFFVHPAQELVQLQSRSRLELQWHDTFIPFPVLEIIYYKMLEARIAKAQQGGALASGADSRPM